MRLDDILRSQQESFELLYQGQPAPEVGTLHQGLPAWEVGYPQPAFQHLVKQGKIKGPVLDVGCGAGETVSKRVQGEEPLVLKTCCSQLLVS